MMHANDDLDPGYDFEITKTTRRAAGAGTWVIGRIAGYRFDALVFPEHADCPDWELGESRISKLWLQRSADRATVFNWDRGADIAAASDLCKRWSTFWPPASPTTSTPKPKRLRASRWVVPAA